jgi:hypothetical protein
VRIKKSLLIAGSITVIPLSIIVLFTCLNVQPTPQIQYKQENKKVLQENIAQPAEPIHSQQIQDKETSEESGVQEHINYNGSLKRKVIVSGSVTDHTGSGLENITVKVVVTSDGNDLPITWANEYGASISGSYATANTDQTGKYKMKLEYLSNLVKTKELRIKVGLYGLWSEDSSKSIKLSGTQRCSEETARDFDLLRFRDIQFFYKANNLSDDELINLLLKIQYKPYFAEIKEFSLKDSASAKIKADLKCLQNSLLILLARATNTDGKIGMGQEFMHTSLTIPGFINKHEAYNHFGIRRNDDKYIAAFEILPDQMFKVSCSVLNYQHLDKAIEPLKPGERRVVDLALNHGSITFKGRCINWLGKPVEGKWMVVAEQNYGTTLAENIDKNGCFTLNLVDENITKLTFTHLADDENPYFFAVEYPDTKMSKLPTDFIFGKMVPVVGKCTTAGGKPIDHIDFVQKLDNGGVYKGSGSVLDDGRFEINIFEEVPLELVKFTWDPSYDELKKEHVMRNVALYDLKTVIVDE